MITKLLVAIGLAALWGSGAQAAQITFGPSNQSITFTGNGANSVTVSSPTLTGSAFDTTNAQLIAQMAVEIPEGNIPQCPANAAKVFLAYCSGRTERPFRWMLAHGGEQQVSL